MIDRIVEAIGAIVATVVFLGSTLACAWLSWWILDGIFG